MLRRELRSLEESSSSCVLHSLLQSGLTRGLSLSEMDGNNKAGAEATRNSQASDVQELYEKQQMARKNWSMCELTLPDGWNRWSRPWERDGLAW